MLGLCTPKQRYYIGHLIWKPQNRSYEALALKEKARLYCHNRLSFSRDGLVTLNSQLADKIIDALLKCNFSEANFLFSQFFGEEWDKLIITYD